MNWYLKVLKNYAVFSGRARRLEYWMWISFNMIFGIVTIIIDNLLGSVIDGNEYGLVSGLYLLSVFIPGLAVSVRRLHDVGKSGWMFLISLIPIIGTIWFFILMISNSVPGTNEYGANPKENTYRR